MPQFTHPVSRKTLSLVNERSSRRRFLGDPERVILHFRNGESKAPMNEALIYKKSGEEDQLTSDVFGLLKYLPPNLVLTPFLEKARCFDQIEERTLVERIGFSPIRATFFFWPSVYLPATHDSRALDRQPDLLLLLDGDSGESAAVVVEVKFRGNKHNVDARPPKEESTQIVGNRDGNTGLLLGAQDSEVDGDQLENYLRALLHNGISLRIGTARAANALSGVGRKYAEEEVRLKQTPRERRFLLYLTSGETLPEDERDATLRRFGNAHTLPKDEFQRLFWSGWPDLYEIVEEAIQFLSHGDKIYQPILDDISRLLDARDLRVFNGWKETPYIAVFEDGAYFWNPTWYSEIEPLSPEALDRVNFWKELSPVPGDSQQ